MNNNIIKIKKINKNINLYRFYLFLLDNYPKMMLLESTKQDQIHLGRYSILGVHPFLTLKQTDGALWINNQKATPENQNDLFGFIRLQMQIYQIESIPEFEQHEINFSEFPFFGGAIGYFSYDFCNNIASKVFESTIEIEQYPSFYLNFYNLVFVVDHVKKQSYFITYYTQNEVQEQATRLWEYYETFMKLPPLKINTDSEKMKLKKGAFSTTFKSNLDFISYQNRFFQLKKAIQDGEVYIANLTRQFTCKTEKSPENIYDSLRIHNPAPFAALLNCEDFQLISSSPERFLKLQQKQVETCPIKGTRPRGHTPEADQAYYEELVQSEKDRAELLMIVDLERNDLSQVCQLHSVCVPELFRVEQYQTVQHLVSTVTGTLRPECDGFDLLKATFPGGSITGAPKKRAMQILNDLENYPRGPYTGALGYISFHGNMDFNILIRTILLKNKRAYFGTGGGITWDSDVSAEWQETLDKAYALMSSLL